MPELADFVAVAVAAIAAAVVLDAMFTDVSGHTQNSSHAAVQD